MFGDTNKMLIWVKKHACKRDIDAATYACMGGEGNLTAWQIKRLIVLLRRYETKTRKIKNVA